VVPVKITCTLPEITDSLLSLFLIVVSIELVNVFKLPVDVSIFVSLLFCVSFSELNEDDILPILELRPDVVVATDELKAPIDELNPLVVVATEELKDPIEELRSEVVVAAEELNELIDKVNPDVVDATDELREPIDKVKPLVVVAIDELSVEIVPSKLELNEPILADTLELNVEYPVVPVIKTWIEPDITFSSFISFLILVSIELVNVLYEDVEFSIAKSLPSFDEVYA